MTDTYFKKFDDCDSLNEYIAETNHKVIKWQMAKLCTGNTVIMAQFERNTNTQTVLNEYFNYEVKYE